MPQNINLNVSPYYDDFNDSKNYYKVLFKPGTSIQARELTTLQSILQNQIEKFGKHFFKDGAMVIPGNIAFDSNYTCVEINSIHLGIPVIEYLNNLQGKTIKGQTSNVVAKIEAVIDEDASERGNNTLYIKYQSSSQSNFISSNFIEGENLVIQEDVDYSLGVLKANNTIATTISNDCNSVGSAVKISSGVYFIRGFFLNIKSQTLILDQYSNTPSYRVGIAIKESFAVASNEYNDLLDNSQGFYNYAAPGADRLLIENELVKKSLDDFNDGNFVQLLKVNNGILEKIVSTTDYNIFSDELARRTYEESGDYYIKPFDIQVKESLNDYLGNNGVYNEGQITKQGATPSNDLACISISPGKAYVRGYEVESISNTIIDLEKTRTTDTAVNEAVQFNFGTQLELNNVYGNIPVGYSTNSYVKLYRGRTQTVGVASDIQIGVARLYDLKLKSSAYENSASIFDASLYDIQTYTTLEVSSGFGQSLTESTHIEGKNSGANGYLVSGISSTASQFNLYQVSGNFVRNEPLIINGIENNRIIKSVIDYGINDVKQITSYNTSPATFTADPVLSRKIDLSDNQSSYTISAGVSGVSTITTSNSNFYADIKVGDIVSYTKSGDSLSTYNVIQSINSSLTSATIKPTSSVYGVNLGTLPTSTITVNDLRKVTVNIQSYNNSLYSKLNHNYVSTVDLTTSNITLRKTLDVINITNSEVFEISIFEGIEDSILVPFDEEAYSLVYSDGVIEKLSPQKLIPNYSSSNLPAQGRITLRNLDITAPKSAILTITYQKIGCKTRKKTFNRCSQITINSTNSGINTINSGLNYSEVYGCRIEDSNISLNVPEVSSIIGIYESSNSNDPILPTFTVSSISENIINLIKGENIIGSDTKTVATLIDTDNISKVTFGYLNDKVFKDGEIVRFKESGITAEITNINLGDRNISNSYIFDNGSRESYLDFSRIIRKPSVEAPKKKITIVYNYYSIDSRDNGTFVAVNSYDLERYDAIPLISNIECGDILDFRPRVLNYDKLSLISPFEFKSRIFNSSNASSKDIIAKDSSTILSYNYYLPRIDKLFLSKYGTFNLVKGIPSLSSKLPEALDYSLEIATLYLPPYIYNVDDIKIKTNTHKRYTMMDISRLDDRISNVEYYTSLSLLETDTQNLTITDSSTNLNRFKSGFFVDNFSSYNGGDITNPVYRASVDANANLLRPQSYTTYIDLELDLNSNVNVKKVGDVICLNYSDVIYVQNKFATRVENINPFNVINWLGNIELNPSTDTWVEPKIISKKEDNVEGDYLNTLNRLSADSNTGLSPVEWGAWNVNWVGTPVATRGSSYNELSNSQVIGETTEVTDERTRGHNRRQRVTTNTTIRDTFTNFTPVTTSIDVNKSRRGIQNKITERFDSVVVGNRIVSKDVITTIRSRNIGILSKRLKPNTRFYGFFDNVDVSSYIIPKLIEIEMITGTFNVGEDVEGNFGNASIKFRLSSQNHKYGEYNSPSTTYSKNPYDVNSTIYSNYSSTSTILNVDIKSLQLQSESQYYGYISTGMRLVGKTSGAIAIVKDIRVISDSSGTFIGSLFLPDPLVPTNPKFTTGTKTFTLTTSSINSTIPGTTDSSAEVSFISSGLIENIEEHTLRIRNANIERIPLSESSTNTITSSSVETSTSFVDRSVTNTRFIDPLAQSFEVTDRTGIYITKCEIFFKTKDTNDIPVTLQIRTMQNGIPTQKILPFGEVVLDSKDVNVSDTSLVPTSFIFTSPIYLEGGNSYCIVLISASDSYNVWISRMGEEDVSSLSLQEGNRILVSQQPTLGSLFKSQNASTWDASQYEDLKFNLYRAEFTSKSGTATFYNPILGVGNRQIASLRPNPITTYSRSLLVKLNTVISSSEVSLLKSSYNLSQTSNSKFSSKVKSVVGTISTNSNLTIVNSGVGYTQGLTAYTNVDLVSITGSGSGGKITLGVGTGVVYNATITNGGSGYSIGDVLTIDYKDSNNLGKDVILSIPSISGILTSSNSILIDNVQGELITSSGDLIVNGTTLTGKYPIEISEVRDGLHFKVNHNNHGMYSKNNLITLSGIESDVPPAKLITDITSSSTTITLSDVSNFITFEGNSVGIATTGYLIVNSEIIGYIGVNTSTSTVILNTLPGFNRGIDNTVPTSHFSNDLVFKYEFNGISLRKINKQHNLSEVDYTKYPIELDNYHIKISEDNDKFFNNSKTGGSYLYNAYSLTGVSVPRATQNIAYNILHPITSILTPINTEISSKVRTISGTSVNGNETSFLDNGYEEISLNSDNNFSTLRTIYSNINELEYLNTPNNKSLSLNIQLNTLDSKVSPMIDLERVGMISIMNRIDTPVKDYVYDSRVNKLFEDPTSAIYVSRPVRLEKPADSLKVLFDAYRHQTNDIRVAYRIFRNDTPDEYQLYQLFPGYGNINSGGNIINLNACSGLPDNLVTPSGNLNDFKLYEYNVKSDVTFTGFQIKIIMAGTDQANIPKLRDLRVIATL
jgi:hypothetical protein